MTKHRPKDNYAPEDLTRRDFMGATLLGAGAALLTASAPIESLAAAASTKSAYGSLGPDWTGPGGIGDYAASNGNVYSTVNTAHALRDGSWKDETAVLPDSDRVFDLIVVGGGISGLMSSYEFLKLRGRKAQVLVLDNHPIFGGEAKQNELEIDGYRLEAPQGSNMCLWPPKTVAAVSTFWHPVWQELGLPMGDEEDAPRWLTRATGASSQLTFAKDSYGPMMVRRKSSPQIQFFRDPNRSGRWLGARNPWESGYRDFPWPDEAKRQLVRIDEFVLQSPPEKLEQWLDTMTYREYLTQVVGITRKEVFDYLDPMIAAYGCGLGCDAVSALAACTFRGPGFKTAGTAEPVRPATPPSIEPVSFPGGNSAIARFFAKRLIPDAISGTDNLQGILYGEINWAALDRSEQPVRMRLNATAVDVQHDASPNSAHHVVVTYIDNRSGKPHKTRARAVIMGGGQSINKYVIRDAPNELRLAMDEFNHAPMLVINVGVRHWRFMEKMGISAARWLDGFGWFTNIRAPMSIAGKHMPFDPNKPAILTFYNPFTAFSRGVTGAGIPLKAQCIAARAALLGLPFRDIERGIRKQLQDTFATQGFNQEHDIAAVIANRWGHAYLAPQPGFYFGKDSAAAPRDTVRGGFGRVRFCNSELSGEQSWCTACAEGERAAKQVHEFA